MKLIKRTIVKRILVSALALVLAVSAPLTSVLKVRAASLPVSSSESAEAMMALLDILINALIVGGGAEYVANYDNDMDLLDAFLKAGKNLVPVGTAPGDMTFEMSDGSTITLDDLVIGVEEGTLALPDVQQWGQYRVFYKEDYSVMLEEWEKSGGSPDSKPDPEKEPSFDKLKALEIGAAALSAVGAFFGMIWNNEVDDLDPNTYFNLNGLDGFTARDISRQSNGHGYTLRASSVHEMTGSQYCKYCESQEYSYGYSVSQSVFNRICIKNSSGTGWFIYQKEYIDKVCSYVIIHACGAEEAVRSSLNALDGPTMSANVPIFTSPDDADNYIKTGKGYEKAVNYKPAVYDNDALISSISVSLSPWTGRRISPSTLHKTYTGTKNAYETEIKPKTDTQTDTQTNTEIYRETVSKIITETIVEPETGTNPGTGTTPGTGTDPNPGTDPGTGTDPEPDTDISNYKVDLRMVFPFCIPFDFIALLNVLDADPVAPCFTFPVVIPALDYREDVKLDLSIFDDVAKVIRLCEKVSFIIFLMFATSKVIRW